MLDVLRSLKRMLQYFIRLLSKWMTMKFNVHDNRIIFGAWFGKKYDDNSKALYEYVVNNRPDLDAYWITPTRRIVNELKSQHLPVCWSFSIKGLYICMTAKYSVTSTSPGDIGLGWFSPLLLKVTYVNLWHGVPLKKIMYDVHPHITSSISETSKGKSFWLTKLRDFSRKNQNEVYNVSTSEAISKIYESAFRCDSNHILNLGQARNDYFYIEHCNSIRETYSGKRIIVYMPTHRNAGQKLMNMKVLLNLSKIDEICKKYNAVFLIKKHFYHNKEQIIDNSEYSNIKELSHMNIKSQELIDSADILITDYSSTYIDYLLLERPIIFYAYDLQEYLKTDRDLYLDYNQDNIPGRICTNKKDLEDELTNLLLGRDNYKSLRTKMRDYYYSKENQSIVSPKQIDAIMKL